MSKISVVITDRVRIVLDDAAKSDWTDPQLLLWFNDARRTIISARPDTRIAADGTEIAFTEKTKISETRQLGDEWIPAEVDYVASRAFEQDAGDKRDMDRSAHHWDNFSRYITIL